MSTQNRKGFSLIEVIVAATLLGIAVVVICSGSARAMAGVKANRQYEEAMDVLDRQLTLIDHLGIEEFIEGNKNSGVVGDQQQGTKEYFWEMNFESLGADNLYKVTMTVYWHSGSKIRKVSAVTMLNQKAALEVDEEADQNETGDSGTENEQ